MGFFPTFKFEFFCPSSSMQIGCKVKVKGIFWPPRPDIILVSRFLPENLIWPQISSEIGPQWTRQSLICNMCGRIFPQVASFKKHTICSCQHIMNIHFIASFSTNISSKVGFFLIICLDMLWRNESKSSSGNRNPFVGWTLACPGILQLSHRNSQQIYI